MVWMPSLRAVVTVLVVLFTGVDINEDLIWCVNIGLYMGFCVIVGSDYSASP